MPFNTFLPKPTLFLFNGGLGWIGHPLVFHGVEFCKKIDLVSLKKYLCSLEYLQEGNGLLGVLFGVF